MSETDEQLQQVIEINAEYVGEECPNPECDLTVAAIEPDDVLHVTHETEDGMFNHDADSESRCHIDPDEHDSTVEDTQ